MDILNIILAILIFAVPATLVLWGVFRINKNPGKNPNEGPNEGGPGD